MSATRALLRRGCYREDLEYLGDGVYAGFDGYQYWLATERSAGAVQEIAIEPQVLHALNNYAMTLKAKYRAKKPESETPA